MTVTDRVYVVLEDNEHHETSITAIHTNIDKARAAQDQAANRNHRWIETWAVGDDTHPITKTIQRATEYALPGRRRSHATHVVDASAEFTDYDYAGPNAIGRHGWTREEADRRLDAAIPEGTP